MLAGQPVFTLCFKRRMKAGAGFNSDGRRGTGYDSAIEILSKASGR
jgi:hypothetical protein